MSTDDYFEDERDLEADMAPASFHPSDDWWRDLLGRMNAAQRRKLIAGEYSMTLMNAHGVESVALVAPDWVRDLDAPGL